jgi:transcription antitermination factor NusG
MTAFYDRTVARKLKAQALPPRNSLARINRAIALANEKAAKVAKNQPLDASRPLPHGLRLFVLRVASQREFEAARLLESIGWFTITPLRQENGALKSPKRGGKREPRLKIIRPQLAGYMLAGYAGNPNWYALDEYPKLIYGTINRNGTPLQLSEKQVARFQVEASKIVMVESLKKGSRVRLTEGPFAGHECDITKIKGRVVVVLQRIFDGEHEVSVPIDSLEIIEKKAA